jgi:hypothetical protein
MLARVVDSEHERFDRGSRFCEVPTLGPMQMITRYVKHSHQRPLSLTAKPVKCEWKVDSRLYVSISSAPHNPQTFAVHTGEHNNGAYTLNITGVHPLVGDAFSPANGLQHTSTGALVAIPYSEKNAIYVGKWRIPLQSNNRMAKHAIDADDRCLIELYNNSFILVDLVDPSKQTTFVPYNTTASGLGINSDVSMGSDNTYYFSDITTKVTAYKHTGTFVREIIPPIRGPMHLTADVDATLCLCHRNWVFFYRADGTLERTLSLNQDKVISHMCCTHDGLLALNTYDATTGKAALEIWK